MLKVIIYHDTYFLPSSNSDIKKIKKQIQREDDLHRSLRRSKAMIKDIMLSNRFDLWCTFTYNCRNCEPKCTNDPCTCLPSNCKRYDLNYTRRTLAAWFINQRRGSSPDLQYLAVPEYHKNGAIHFHCLLSGFQGRLRDSGHKTKFDQTIYNAPGYYSGWTEFVKIGERFDSETFDTDYRRVMNYLTKYITKDMPLIHGRRRYLVSSDIARPIKTINGVSVYDLQQVIRNYKPKYIDSRVEVQEHPKVGVLTSGSNATLF